MLQFSQDSNSALNNAYTRLPRCEMLDAWWRQRQCRPDVNVRPDGSMERADEDLRIVREYALFVASQYARPHSDRSEKQDLEQDIGFGGGQGRAIGTLLREHPKERISAFLSSFDDNFAARERAYWIIYNEFYKWAFEHGHSRFDPRRFTEVLPFVHIAKEGLPYTLLMTRFCEYLISPPDSAISGLGIERKQAQQVARSARDFLKHQLNSLPEEMRQSVCSGMDSVGTDLGLFLQERALNDTPSMIEPYLCQVEKNKGRAVRSQIAYHLGLLHEFMQRDFGVSPLPKPRREEFPGLECPIPPILLNYRERLLELSELPDMHPEKIMREAALAKERAVRGLIQEIWRNHFGASTEISALAIEGALLSLNAEEIEQHIIKQVENAAVSDASRDSHLVRRKIQSLRSALKSFFRWAYHNNYIGFNPDQPAGELAWFRVPLSDMPTLKLFNDFCDFLGREVRARESDASIGIGLGTAKNYRAKSAKFIKWCWQQYCSESNQLHSPEEFEQALRASLQRQITNYLKARALSKSALIGEASALRGIFGQWVEGKLTAFSEKVSEARKTRPVIIKPPKLKQAVNQRPVNETAAPPLEEPVLAQRGLELPAPDFWEEIKSSISSSMSSVELMTPTLTERRVLLSGNCRTFEIYRDKAITELLLIPHPSATGASDRRPLITVERLYRLQCEDFRQGSQELLIRDQGNQFRHKLNSKQFYLLDEYFRVRTEFLAAHEKRAKRRINHLFMCPDGGRLFVYDSSQALRPFDQDLSILFALQRGLIGYLAYEARFSFRDILQLRLPAGFAFDRKTVTLRGEGGKCIEIALSKNNFQRFSAYYSGVIKLGLAECWKNRQETAYFFVGNDGRSVSSS